MWRYISTYNQLHYCRLWHICHIFIPNRMRLHWAFGSRYVPIDKAWSKRWDRKQLARAHKKQHLSLITGEMHEVMANLICFIIFVRLLLLLEVKVAIGLGTPNGATNTMTYKPGLLTSRSLYQTNMLEHALSWSENVVLQWAWVMRQQEALRHLADLFWKMKKVPKDSGLIDARNSKLMSPWMNAWQEQYSINFCSSRR